MAAFSSLTDRLSNAFKHLKSKGKLSEADIDGTIREIRRALSAIGLVVNRLIRVSYGPFRLGDLQPGDVSEVRGEFLAIDTALAQLKAGDLCLILIDQVEEALEHIAKRIAEAG